MGSATIGAVGDVVLYRLAHHDVTRGAERRTTGTSPRSGNPLAAGEQYPMLIVRTWDSTHASVQGQVFVDGDYTLWVTSVKQGDEEGQWQ